MNKEIVSFNAGEMTAKSDALENIEKYQSGCRHLESMLPRIYGSAERRPGTIITGVAGELKRAIYSPPHNAITYFSEVGQIWGIPLDFSNYTALTLDTDGVARDIGGGVVGLPCAGHPFVAAQVVRIVGTTNYNGVFTLQSGTAIDELRITDTYNAETFDGTETVVQFIDLAASVGRMDMDEDGNLYFGTNIISANCVTKVSDAGLTINTTFLTPDTAFNGTTCVGIKVSTNSDYLYVYANYNRIWKFDLSDGSQVWSVGVSASINYRGFNIDIDSSDNVYVCQSSKNLAKVAAADGVVTVFTDTKGIGGIAGVYDVHVNNSMSYTSGKTGVVITGGFDSKLANDTGIYNLSIRDLDDTGGTQIALGGTYEDGALWKTYIIATGFIITYNNYIYVLCNNIVYKLDTDLATIATIAAGDMPDYPAGLFVDFWGRIVIIDQDFTSYDGTDIFYFYDTDLNFINKTPQTFYLSILSSWDALAYTQGNVVFPTPRTVIG